MEAINITLPRLLIMYSLLLAPFALIVLLKLPLKKLFGTSFIRMTAQLILVGLYLRFIFKINSPVLTISWVVVMICIANYSVLKSTKLSWKKFAPLTLPGMLLSIGLVLFFMLLLVVVPTPWYEPRYLIPMGGMLLGNSLQSLIISLDRFMTLLKRNRWELYSSFTMGATRTEAITPYIREALQAAITPALMGIATIGLVSLPGMMTGQMLGGSFPLVAIKYQLVIMIAIFTAQVLTASLNILLCSNRFFDENQRLLLEIE